jgi:putative transcriptional regulator
MPQKRLQSLKGSLLLDGGKLTGSWFHRTVVLICRHDATGAFGLVLNRPEDRRLGEVLGAELPESLEGENVFNGGPVQPTALSFLHLDPAMLLPNVIDHVRVAHDLNELDEVGRGWMPNQRLRVFAGYAGWSPGQLEREMRQEAWLTHPATSDLLFHVPPDGLWRAILKSRPQWEERILADAPEDLGWN